MASHDPQNPTPSPGQVWQLPALAAGLILFGLGMYMAAPRDQTEQYGTALEDVAALIKAGRHEKAVDALQQLKSGIDDQPKPLRSRWHRLMGDAVFLGNQSNTWEKDLGYDRVVRAYDRSVELGPELDTRHKQRRAEALAATDRTEEALETLAQLGPEGADLRQKMLKRMIRRAMDRAEPGKRANKLIQRLLDAPQLTHRNEVWAVARQGELMMRRDRTGRAVDMLLRRLARLRTADADKESNKGSDEPPDPALAELMVMLGKAYLADGDPANAERWLLKARQALDESDPLNAEVLTGLGRIRFGENNVIEALEHYAKVVQRYPETDAYPDALLGKAESEARRGALEPAVGDYQKAVELALRGPPQPKRWRQRLLDSLRNQHEVRFSQGNYDEALRFLDLEAKLYQDGETPADLHLKRAMSHERLGRQVLGVDPGQEAPQEKWRQLPPQQRKRAAEHYAKAADAYYDHAQAVAVDDNAQYGQSLWRAADYYDKAGLHQEAIATFEEFADGRPDDPKRLKALHRLAQAHQAAGNLEKATKLYQKLVEDHPQSPEAYDSLVPLARTYIARGPEFTDRAEQVLRSVINDHPALRPESREYRRALAELGQLYYRGGEDGDYEKAIKRLSEAVKRYSGELTGGDAAPDGTGTGGSGEANPDDGDEAANRPSTATSGRPAPARPGQAASANAGTTTVADSQSAGDSPETAGDTDQPAADDANAEGEPQPATEQADAQPADGSSDEAEAAPDKAPGLEQHLDLVFQLGDAYRKSVQQIEQKLSQSIPPAKRAKLQSERATRLDRARQYYEQVIELAQKRSPESLSDLEKLHVRNSYFYRADCAYDLGEYEGPDGAIELYKQARRRYEDDPTALIALVQIVNAYAELGEWEAARRANERAKVHLKRIPDEAFDDPNLPMTREHWQRWLDSTSELALKEEDSTAQAEENAGGGQ